MLKQVAFDPVDGTIALIGAYDDGFDIGDIACLGPPKTALEFPYPVFSLEPTPETAAIRSKHRDPDKVAGEFRKFLFGHPDCEQAKYAQESDSERFPVASSFGPNKQWTICIGNKLILL